MMQKYNLKLSKSFIVLAIVLPLVTVGSIVIFFQFKEAKEQVFKVLKEYLIQQNIYSIEHYTAKVLKEYGKNLDSKILKDKTLHSSLEKQLFFAKNEDVKYLYMLYRAKDGKYRYLLDTTQKLSQRAFVNQKFDVESDIWDKAYDTKKYQIVEQKKLQTLWITLAYPVVIDNKVVAVIGADFSYDVYNKIVSILEPIENIFMYIGFFMLIMLFLAYILVYLYYKTRKKSYIDPLTKVYNRQYLGEFLETTSLQNYALMMIDLDKFKLINDNYGHETGDDVLVAVAQEIRSNIRKEDLLIRFGGEEFIVLVDKQESKDAYVVAERIRKGVMEREIISDNNKIKMTLSIGVNPFPYNAKNIDEAIKIADEQLYIAKSSGRNRVEMFNESKQYESSSSKRISDISLAIDEDRIKCAFQPIYGARTREIMKYELLLRMVAQDGKIVPPNSFLPSIRHTQVYIRLTDIVLQKAITTLENNKDIKLSINLDIQDILNEDIMNLLQKRFHTKKMFAKRVTIEILEHEEITNFDMIKQRISQLKFLGFSIALDDFGSGYANFTYMIHLDIDILKIDGSIIQNIDKDEAAYNIVKAIVAFSRSMNMSTIAEFVETKEEYETLLSLDVDCIQGYYLGRPEFIF